MALPRYDCWFQICVHKAARSSVSTDLGKSFILDILPATLGEFVTWSQLGPQIDPDGDGLGKTVDPDQTKYDTDGDGVPDKIEYEYGVVRGYGFSPTQADADGDGLNDAAEMRYATNPRKLTRTATASPILTRSTAIPCPSVAARSTPPATR